MSGFTAGLETEAVFDLDQFIADCRSALAEKAPQHAIREAVMRVVADQDRCFQGIRRAEALRDPEAHPLSRSYDSQRRLGSPDDTPTSRSPNVGGHRHLHSTQAARTTSSGAA